MASSTESDRTEDAEYTDEDAEQTSSSRGSWNTVKPEPKRGRSFSTSLTLAFAMVAVMAAVIFVVVLAYVWEGEFQDYTRQNMQDVADSTARMISDVVEETGSLDAESAAEAESASTVSEDIFVQVVDLDGNVLYDDSVVAVEVQNSDSGAVVYVKIAGTNPVSEDAVVTSDIVSPDGEVIGSVRLWTVGSEMLLTETDVSFRTNSYIAIAGAAVVAVVLASITGFAFSHRMTKPINKITSTAKQIRNGDLTARSGVSGKDEIGQLGETFDDMATSLERDIELEHRLTGDVAHELRTPLMAMQATVEAMQDGVLPADEENLERVASEVRRLSRLIDAMLKLSRLENGTTELNIEHTDIVGLIKGLVGSQHQLFHESGIHLRFIDETPSGELYADVDPDLVREAVVNLMSNALRYTDPGGWVRVSVSWDRAESEVVISVRDTGIGIAKEDIPMTFSRFWRSDASRERESGGLGVGLSITKEIVDRHNGTISVESELGKGSTFTIRLPQHQQRRSLTQTLQER